MTENLKATITANERSVEFVLSFDPDFPPDRNMRVTLSRDGACEPEIVHLMSRVLEEGDIAVDGGANVGFFTLLMSRYVGDSGQIFAIEPTPVNQQKIRHNLANNKIKNVHVIDQALYDSTEMLTLHMGHDTGSNSLVAYPEAVGRMQVRATTIDDLLGDRQPRLIKLDVEGAEHSALVGAQEALKYKPYVVCELNEQALRRFGTSRKDLRHFMRHLGFELFLLHGDGTLPRYVPAETEIKSSKQNLMGLFATSPMVSAAWPEVQID